MKISYLYNPFIRIAGFKSFAAGTVGLLLTTFLAYKTGTHLEGVLNVDFAKDSDYWFFLLENLLSWVLVSIFLYLSGIILSKSRIRIIDVLGVTLFSRIPLLITPLIRTIAFQSFMFQSWQMYFIMGIYLLSAIWTIILLFNGFKVSCNLRNERLVASFIISLSFSEIGSKLIMLLIN